MRSAIASMPSSIAHTAYVTGLLDWQSARGPRSDHVEPEAERRVALEDVCQREEAGGNDGASLTGKDLIGLSLIRVKSHAGT